MVSPSQWLISKMVYPAEKRTTDPLSLLFTVELRIQNGLDDGTTSHTRNQIEDLHTEHYPLNRHFSSTSSI